MSLLVEGQRAVADTAETVRTGANRRLTAQVQATRGKDAPGLAVNPDNPDHVVEVNVDVIAKTCESHVSFDGGVTWTGGPLPVPAGFPEPPCDLARSNINMDGSVAFGSKGHVYTTFAAARPGESMSVLVSRSIDGGRTFSTVVAMPGGPPRETGRFLQPKLAVQRTMGLDRLFVAAVLGGRLRQGSAMVSRSDDGGSTWSVPNDAANGQQVSEVSQPVVTGTGTVAVSWQTAPTLYVTPTELSVGWSPDGGRTWLQSVPAPSSQPSLFPRLAAHPRDNTLYVVYMEGPPPASGYASAPQRTTQDDYIVPDADVLVTRSTDGGLRWSRPVRVNDDPVGNGVAQRHPNISVAPTGRVDIVWHDRRHAYKAPTNAHAGNGEARLGDTYYAFSTDGGASFSSNRRITDRMINNDIGLDYRCCNYWFSGPVAAAMGPDRLLVAWSDSREGSFDSDAQDIYLATVDHGAAAAPPERRLPPASSSARSIQLSQLAYPGGSEAVLAPTTFANAAVTKPVFVGENDVAAAMAGAVLSRAALAPLLVSPGGGSTPELEAEIRRLAPIGAYLLGDAAAPSSRLADELAAAGVPSDSIILISGTSSAELAAGVAAAMDRRDDDDREAGFPAFDAAVIANPATPDAASATALAAALRLPFLYVDTDSVPAATRDALDSFGIQRTLVIGGPGAVSDVVLSRLPAPTRLAGPTAAETSAAVAAEGLEQGLPRNQLFVGDAAGPYDAALLGAAAARLGGVLLLQDAGEPSAAVATADRLGIANEVDRLVTLGATRSAQAGGRLASKAPPPSGTLPATGGGGIIAVAAMILVLCLATRRALRISIQEGPCQAHPSPTS